LFLNAASPTRDRSFAKNQAYMMVAVLDEKRSVIPGFKAEKCLEARFFLIPTCYFGIQLRSVGKAQGTGHGQHIGQPAIDGGLGLFPLSSLSLRASAQPSLIN